MTTSSKKLEESIKELRHALELKSKIKSDRFYFLGIVKSFEVCIEYAWKYFKQRGIEEGLEVFSPKEAIKIAGRLGIIDDVEKWLKFLNDRNASVHDYLGIPDDSYLKTVEDFFDEVSKIKFLL